MLKYFFLFVCTLIIAANTFGQDTAQINITELDDDKTFVKVETEAEFPGGPNAWFQHLASNLNSNIPIDNGAPAGTYTVIILFLVHKDGSITDPTPIINPGYGMFEEVKRVIMKSPIWIPAKQNGRIVRAYRRQPVTFVVEDVYKEKKKKKRRLF
ncbi:MAG: hypothetical protein V4556_08160 [Bacteroidota bacterium]